MFFKNKILFFILQFIFCIFLVYFINQQVVLIGVLDNFIVGLFVIYILILLVSFLLSKISTQIYILFSKLIKHHIHKRFIKWLFFTSFCYILTFFIFAIAIEY